MCQDTFEIVRQGIFYTVKNLLLKTKRICFSIEGIKH